MTSKNEPVLCGIEFTASNLERNRRHGSVTPGGVVYDGELCGPGGMSYVLLREPTTTEQQLKDAVSFLRNEHDVVGTIKVTAIIEPEVARERARQ